MAKLIFKCPTCQEKTSEKSRFKIGNSRFVTLECGHTYKEALGITNVESIRLSDGKELYPYQVKGVHFAEESAFNCLIADEQGLGKTIQSVALLQLHLEELKPVLIVVKASLTYQWQRHIMQELEKFAQIVTTKSDILPGLSIYITSWDTAGKLESEWKKVGIKTVILDECQMMKNHDAKRTNGIRAIVNSVQDPTKAVKNKIALSGTPIKNHAIEYWPILNLLKPERFPNRAAFCNYEVDYYVNNKGIKKPGGIKYPDQFHSKTKDFIIRRTKKEVHPELPEMTRDYRYFQITKDEMEAYMMGVKKLADFLKTANKKDFNFNSQLQGHIMILRHITGLAKINPMMEFIDDELVLSKQDEPWKLALYHHHIDVGNIFQEHLKIREIGHVRITSSDPADVRMSKLDQFRKDDDTHMMVAPSGAMTEGYDLDFCDLGALVEREWNPANEEQIEGRFIRATPEMIERAKAGELKVSMIYPIAVGTIDEYFAELVERKRVSVKETLEGKKAGHTWDESQIMLELAEIAISKWKR